MGNVEQIDVLWITAGLSCDGDSIAMTAATQPSIEDLVLGALPMIPKVVIHNPLLAVHSGAELLAPFERAARGESAHPFVLVVEGSIPNEAISGEGCWAGFGSDPQTGRMDFLGWELKTKTGSSIKRTSSRR